MEEDALPGLKSSFLKDVDYDEDDYTLDHIIHK
jgi:hypothetical protein